MKKSIKRLTLAVLTLLCLPVLNSNATEKRQDIIVSILPQEYFVERIGGDRVNVTTVVPQGSSPATYDPTSQTLAKMTSAKLYFRIGVPFEKGFIPKIRDLNEDLKIIDTRKGIKLRTMTKHHHEDEHALHEDEHSTEDSNKKHHNEAKDPHTWLNPMNVKIQAKTIADALSDIDPEGASIYESNYKNFCADLDKLDKFITEKLLPLQGKILMVFHPAWGYFADQYGLKQQAIEIEGKTPTAKQLANIISTAKKENIQVIFVQPQFSKASAISVAKAIGGSVVPVNPLSKDYINNLKGIAQKMASDLKNQK